MGWKKVIDGTPSFGKSVLVFRSDSKKYTVAKLEEGKTPKQEWHKNRAEYDLKYWRSSFGNALRLRMEDYWTEFEPLTLTETFG